MKALKAMFAVTAVFMMSNSFAASDNKALLKRIEELETRVVKAEIAIEMNKIAALEGKLVAYEGFKNLLKSTTGIIIRMEIDKLQDTPKSAKPFEEAAEKFRECMEYAATANIQNMKRIVFGGDDGGCVGKYRTEFGATKEAQFK